MHPAAIERGIATRATAAMVTGAFALPDVARLEIVHDLANAASGAIPRRLGFTEVFAAWAGCGHWARGGARGGAHASSASVMDFQGREVGRRTPESLSGRPVQSAARRP
ncbi:GNAT family N-acetyltransferase [Streptomyces sp. NBC_01750]|uniref:GNAT family N-acetyltransferase n=1 Tax=Streptomyces sp. NBC_01750 TaxID=2975928 RepID=UPI002DD8DEBB|nr:GNAT family N-acetyltransferase [Streptomyces sp. NBC_01750]